LEAEKAVEAAQEKFDDAQKALENAQASIKAKQDAVSSAQAAVNAKQKELDDAKAALKAEQEKPADPAALDKPGSGDLSFSVSKVDFGTLEKGATRGLSDTFEITNNGKYTMRLSASSPSGFTVSGIPSSLKAGESAEITITVSSASSTGIYDKYLNIEGYYEDGGLSGDSRTFSLSVYAKVAEAGYTITVDPASKDLGKLKEGYSEKAAEEKEITVTVKNTGASSVRMDGVKGNDHFAVTAVRSESVTLDNDEKTEYKIVPKQDLKEGTYTDTITFQTREGATAAFKATVVIEKSVAPLTIEPTIVDFGSAEEGYAQPAAKTVTVKNNTERAIRLEQPNSYSYVFSQLSATSLAAGGTATFTIAPRTGMTENNYNGVVMVQSDDGDSAKLDVRFIVTKKIVVSAFSDVAAGSTFADDISYVSQKGLMSGKGGGLFKPQDAITRGQLVTILYRLEGQPAVSGEGFSDVAAGSYCENAVKWAAANGITNGGKDGTFKPNDPITREQMATFLYRYNSHKGYDVTKRADLSAFPDGASVASYAKDAMSWANGAGLVNGTSDGRLNPSGGATRGQAAAILHRFCVSIGK